MVVRFEDIIADPVGQFTRIVNHLKMPVDKAQIKAASEAALKAHKIEGRTAQPNAWKGAMSQDHARALVEVHARQMARFGYLTNDVLNYVGLSREVALNSSAKFEEMARTPVAGVGHA
jgi:hypothetical protein